MPLLHGVYSIIILFISKFVSPQSKWKTSLCNVNLPFINPIMQSALHRRGKGKRVGQVKEITNATCLAALKAPTRYWCDARRDCLQLESADMLKDAHEQRWGGAEETHLSNEREAASMWSTNIQPAYRWSQMKQSTHLDGIWSKAALQLLNMLIRRRAHQDWQKMSIFKKIK